MVLEKLEHEVIKLKKNQIKDDYGRAKIAAFNEVLSLIKTIQEESEQHQKNLERR